MADKYSHKSSCEQEIQHKIDKLNELVEDLKNQKNNFGIENSNHLISLQDEIDAIVSKLENDVIPYIDGKKANLRGE